MHKQEAVRQPGKQDANGGATCPVQHTQHKQLITEHVSHAANHAVYCLPIMQPESRQSISYTLSARQRPTADSWGQTSAQDDNPHPTQRQTTNACLLYSATVAAVPQYRNATMPNVATRMTNSRPRRNLVQLSA